MKILNIQMILSEEYQEKVLPIIKENLEKIIKLKNKGYKIVIKNKKRGNVNNGDIK